MSVGEKVCGFFDEFFFRMRCDRYFLGYFLFNIVF